MTPSTLLPLIDTKTASLALRLTCETNRRLYRSTTPTSDNARAFNPKSTEKAKVSMGTATTPFGSPPPPPSSLVARLSQHVYSEEQIPRTIQKVTEAERVEESLKEEFTVFHASEPCQPDNDKRDDNRNETVRKGVLRWGPDLKLYLDTLLSAIGLDESESKESETSTTSTTVVSTHTTHNKQQLSPLEDERQLILSLTLLYMDHSTSLETVRHVDPNTGQPWYPPCPYVLPQTAHRLVLTAMIIATKCVRGDPDVSNALREAANSLLGNEDGGNYAISESDLENMERWMIQALGAGSTSHGGDMHNYHYESHWQIPSEEVGTFVRKWGETFYPERLKAHDERNRSRMERLERFWRDQTVSVFGGAPGAGDHGHGNSQAAWHEQLHHSPMNHQIHHHQQQQQYHHPHQQPQHHPTNPQMYQQPHIPEEINNDQRVQQKQQQKYVHNGWDARHVQPHVAAPQVREAKEDPVW